MKSSNPLRGLFSLAFISWLATGHSIAQDGNWDNDANGNWSDDGNWTGGDIANGINSTASFDNVITANRTITLDSDRIIGNISAQDTSHNYTISGANILTLDVGSGSPIIEVIQSGRTLQINSVITGNDGLLKTGAGELAMTGANTFTGGINLAAGRIVVFNDPNEQSFLGSAGNTLTFTGDAELYNSNGEATISQNITINNGVTGRVTGAFGERTVVNGVLAGSGTMLVQGFSAGYDAEFRNTANTFTGAIEVQSGDSVTLGMASLADSANMISLDSQSNNGAKFEYLSSANAPLLLNNRQFELIVNGSAGTNLGRQPGIVNNAGGANTMTINTDLKVTGTGTKRFFLMGNNGGNNTFAGAIPDAIGGDVLHLYKDSGGKWILSGANTYEGDTTILNGTLEIGGSGQLGAGDYAGNISIGNGDSLVWNSSADQNISGGISDTNGNGTLTKDNSGTLTLSGNNTYEGATTVNGGTLAINGITSSTSVVTVANGGTLGGTGTVGGNTTVESGGTISPGNSPGTLTVAGDLTLDNGSTYFFEGNDLVDVGGTLTLNGSWNLRLGSGFQDGGSTLLFTYGSLSGGGTPLINITGLGFAPTDALTLRNDATSGSIFLDGISAIPEPHTALLGALGLLALFRRRR